MRISELSPQQEFSHDPESRRPSVMRRLGERVCTTLAVPVAIAVGFAAFRQASLEVREEDKGKMIDDLVDRGKKGEIPAELAGEGINRVKEGKNLAPEGHLDSEKIEGEGDN